MKKKILLVGSDRAALEREKGLLDREIFQVSTAMGGKEAVDLHRREKFDVIVMDLDMPGLPSGDDACRIIKTDPELKGVAVLLATQAGDEKVAARCQAAGADGCIRKPADKQELADTLAGVLGVSTRQAIRILVKVRVDGWMGKSFYIANTVDVSVSGLLFECEHELKVGDAVESSFFLPGAAGFNRVVARTEVMRVARGDKGQWLYGVRFIEFREGGPRIIGEYIQKKTGKPCAV